MNVSFWCHVSTVRVCCESASHVLKQLFRQPDYLLFGVKHAETMWNQTSPGWSQPTTHSLMIDVLPSHRIRHYYSHVSFSFLAIFPQLCWFLWFSLQEWGGGAAQSSNGGDWWFIPGPADPWHKAGSPVQCWYQHVGAGPEPEWQHDQREQKPGARTTHPCSGAGRLPGVLWYRRKFLPFNCWTASSLLFTLR